MNKTKLTLAVVSIVVLALPVLAFAQLTTSTTGGLSGRITSLNGVIGAVENAMGAIFGGIAVVMFVVAGILFLTAGGEPEKVQTARAAFLWGIAGVVVGIIAYSIVGIVASVIK